MVVSNRVICYSAVVECSRADSVSLVQWYTLLSVHHSNCLLYFLRGGGILLGSNIFFNRRDNILHTMSFVLRYFGFNNSMLLLHKKQRK